VCVCGGGARDLLGNMDGCVYAIFKVIS